MWISFGSLKKWFHCFTQVILLFQPGNNKLTCFNLEYCWPVSEDNHLIHTCTLLKGVYLRLLCVKAFNFEYCLFDNFLFNWIMHGSACLLMYCISIMASYLVAFYFVGMESAWIKDENWSANYLCWPLTHRGKDNNVTDVFLTAVKINETTYSNILHSLFSACMKKDNTITKWQLRYKMLVLKLPLKSYVI